MFFLLSISNEAVSRPRKSLSYCMSVLLGPYLHCVIFRFAFGFFNTGNLIELQ